MINIKQSIAIQIIDFCHFWEELKVKIIKYMVCFGIFRHVKLAETQWLDKKMDRYPWWIFCWYNTDL
jgi:hypothetical protein